MARAGMANRKCKSATQNRKSLQLIKMLWANHKRIFVEHHCGLDW